jgi:hypothetical protein
VRSAFKAVFWGFLGVRRRADYDADAKGLKPQQIIAAGLASAAVFVLILFGIVKFVTS